MALYGLPRIVVDAGLLHRSFEKSSEWGALGTWLPHGAIPPSMAEYTTNVVHGTKAIHLTNRNVSSAIGGVKQIVDFGQIVRASDLWAGHAWARSPNGSGKVKAALQFLDATGSELSITYGDSVDVDDAGWSSVVVEATVPHGASQAQLYLYGHTDWVDAVFDLASMGPTADFALPWLDYQEIDAPKAKSADDAEGVTTVRHMADIYEYSIQTRPEQSGVRDEMKAVSYYMGRGYTFDAYPDVEDPTTAMFRLVRKAGMKLPHQQARGGPLYSWLITAKSQPLRSGQDL